MESAQPRSLALTPLAPFVLERKTLVAGGHVTTCDTNFSTGVDQIPSCEVFGLKCVKLEELKMAIPSICCFLVQRFDALTKG